MKARKVYLAVDLGAESGRVVAGILHLDRLFLETIHRFPNGAQDEDGTLRWNLRRLFAEIVRGISLASEKFWGRLVSIGVDSWGVDYGLLDRSGELIELPFHYRDSRTEGIMAEAARRVSLQEVFRATGIQPLFLNTLFQLYSQISKKDPVLAQADQLLFIPDLINYWLCGSRCNEYTIASTSQMMDMRTKGWASGLLDRLGIPAELLGDIVEPGTIFGPLRRQIGDRTGAGALRVVAVGAHDTASAVAGTPLGGRSSAFISSGTWSLMGVEITQPVIESRVLENGFSNEGGVEGTIRLLKNITGLWILQECRRRWMEAGESFSYGRLTEMADAAPAFSALIDPDHESFNRPGQMSEKIASFCRGTGQAEPLDHGSVVRVTLESLALKYREVLERLEMVTGSPLETLNIVGGGSQNSLLNQFTANATGRTVVSGPVEATCAGNLIIQLIADGEIDTLAQGRELIAKSSEMELFSPMDAAVWEGGYERYVAVSSDPESL